MRTRNNDKVQYQEKEKLHGFLKIASEIRLNGLSVFTFAVHALLGAIILPITFKLAIETMAEFAYTILLESNASLASIIEYFLLVFQYIQWPLFAIVIASYWFRCNVKAYNYCFTQSAGAKIRRQLAESNTVICPRCGKPMRIRRFTETVREQTGEHEEYYTEWVNFGQKDGYSIRQTEIVPDYSNVEYDRQYAVCENQYCMYSDKRPFRRNVSLYKFSEMPCKISDTVNYAVRTKATTNHAAGNIRQYAHGASLLVYIGICIALFTLRATLDLSGIAFLDQANEFSTFLANLIVCESAVLFGSAVYQVIVHLRNPKRDDDYVELKNRTKDGVTVVLPDGYEFYAQTDHELQRMCDELAGRRLE